MLKSIFIITVFVISSPIFAESKVDSLTDPMGYTEGPAITDDGKVVFFTEAGPAHAIHRYAVGEPGSKVVLEKKDSGGANGMLVRHDRLYVCEDRVARKVAYWTLDEQHRPTERHLIADSIDGKPFNGPNDLAVDAEGGVYFTDPNFAKRNDGPGVEQVYFVTPGGQPVSVADQLERPNGVILSPDEKLLYVADSNGKTIWCFTVESPGKLQDAQVFADVSDYGTPDGMTVDQGGNVFVAIFQGYLLSFAPDGAMRWQLETGNKTSNVDITPDQKTLYFTSEHMLKSLELESIKFTSE